MEVRIVCINKDGGNHDNPNEAVSHYGWLNEMTNESNKAGRQAMVDWVNKGNKAYVVSKYGTSRVYCYVRTSVNGTEFLQTYSNGTYTDNLLELPECR